MNLVFLVAAVITAATFVPVLLQLRRHPRGLFILFFAEMWERFSFYGMRGLLVFYLTQHFLFNDTLAQGQYAAYNSLVYLLPLIGGILADRYLGTRKAIAFGALLLVAGHATMAIEPLPAKEFLTYQGTDYVFEAEGTQEARVVKLRVGGGAYTFRGVAGGLEIEGLPAGSPLPSVLPEGSFQRRIEASETGILFLALSLIIMGVGFLKANISSIVGQLYTQSDPRRDPGFTLYYYGINLGAFWASIACGWLGQEFGWWAGFGAAGIGMLAGFIVFALGKPLLEGKGEPPVPERLKKSVLGPLNLEWSIYLAGIVGVGVIWVIVQRFEIVGWMLAAASVLVLAYLFFVMATRLTSIEVQRMILALVLIVASVVFWTLFEQAGSSLNQFAERSTILPRGETPIGGMMLDYTVTASQVQSFNAGFILLFAPIFSALWAWLGQRSQDPNPAIKFGLALVQVGAGFFVLVWGAQFADAEYRVPLVFLALAYLFHTTGELCLSPVGLSQMTKLSPAAVISTIMATWFLASAWAQWLGGIVAQMTATETLAGQVLDPAKALATYVDTFYMIGIWGAGAGVIMLVLSPILRMLAHDVTKRPDNPVPTATPVADAPKT